MLFLGHAPDMCQLSSTDLEGHGHLQGQGKHVMFHEYNMRSTQMAIG